ncbi:dienelactone hydrolase [Methylobacterium oryzae]|uniref:dienelactone hydrolase family protein n=2 Tax=Methylobacteriaceae TaxID=119045 RepID=UPI002F3380BF
MPKEVFAGDFRAVLGPLMATTSPLKATEDAEAMLAYLDTRDDVEGRKIGVVGFCMGGGMALATAGTYPERFVAAASFHGGNLATDAPTSPHLFAAKLKAEVYIGAAESDGSYPPAMAERLEGALTQAGVRFTTRTYPAAHGWMMPDFPVFVPAAAEQGWSAMLALFGRTLHGGE